MLLVELLELTASDIVDAFVDEIDDRSGKLIKYFNDED